MKQCAKKFRSHFVLGKVQDPTFIHAKRVESIVRSLLVLLNDGLSTTKKLKYFATITEIEIKTTNKFISA